MIDDETTETLNPAADAKQRKEVTWGNDYDVDTMRRKVFLRLKCICGGTAFEVLRTDDFETTAQCIVCHRYYIVHEG